MSCDLGAVRRSGSAQGIEAAGLVSAGCLERAVKNKTAPNSRGREGTCLARWRVYLPFFFDELFFAAFFPAAFFVAFFIVRFSLTSNLRSQDRSVIHI
jgi:hypothetical protein